MTENLISGIFEYNKRQFSNDTQKGFVYYLYFVSARAEWGGGGATPMEAMYKCPPI